LGLLCRSLILDTGIQTYIPVDQLNPKPHACGFDAGGNVLGDADLPRLIKKFGEEYKAQATKSYIKGVAKPDVLKWAKEAGYAYACGPAVQPAQKLCSSARKVLYADIIKGVK